MGHKFQSYMCLVRLPAKKQHQIVRKTEMHTVQNYKLSETKHIY